MPLCCRLAWLEMRRSPDFNWERDRQARYWRLLTAGHLIPDTSPPPRPGSKRSHRAPGIKCQPKPQYKARGYRAAPPWRSPYWEDGPL